MALYQGTASAGPKRARDSFGLQPLRALLQRLKPGVSNVRLGTTKVVP